jgi:hypothetical protein
MKVSEMKEHDDGSATIVLDLTESEKEILILNGIKHAFLASLENLKEWIPEEQKELYGDAKKDLEQNAN